MKTKDGLGNELVDDALYYLQDARGCVGNCGSWWAPKGAGYVCDIDAAGTFTGKECRSTRETDIPWPADYVLARTVRHVRVDNQAFRVVDEPVNPHGTPRICAKCGDPENAHHKRHMFEAWVPGMRDPRRLRRV